MEEWPTVRFGDVVQKMNGKIDLEERAGKLCVRGEHIPRELPPDVKHIVADGDYLGPAFHRTFEAGDVLFATRFPNLNKVGHPTFSGICANTTLVLRSNEDKLLQAVLPYLMKTKSFVDYCILNTRGSTNPYINWTQLADFNFVLPPVHTQKKIAEIMQTFQGSTKKHIHLDTSIKRLFENFRKKLLNGELSKSKWTEKKIVDVATLQRGFDLTKRDRVDGDVPVISSSGIAYYHNESKISGPSVILGRKGSVGSVHYIKEDCWPHDTTLYVKDLHGNDPRFVYHLFKTINLLRYEASSAVPTLNRNNVHPIRVLVPDIDTQKNIVQKLSIVESEMKHISEIISKNKLALFSTFEHIIRGVD